MPEPIKRHEALQELSRDHHEGLLLCFKIRQGLAREIEPERIMDYCRFFYHQYLQLHFREEEETLFPVLGQKHPMIQKALEQHRHLNQLFQQQTASVEKLREIEKSLKAHIRFEERELFNEIQDQLDEDQLQELTHLLSNPSPVSEENWQDPFWT